MTPKEKAIELCESMIHKFDENYIIIVEYTNKRHCAKQCALIAVDLILTEHPMANDYFYWVEVAQEIEKL